MASNGRDTSPQLAAPSQNFLFYGRRDGFLAGLKLWPCFRVCILRPPEGSPGIDHVCTTVITVCEGAKPHGRIYRAHLVAVISLPTAAIRVQLTVKLHWRF